MTDNRRATRPLAWLALSLTAIALNGCGPNAGTGSAASRLRVYAADLAGGAKACEVPSIAPANGQTTQAAIKLGNDGGWCGLPVHQSGPKPFGAGLLTARAAHGTVLIHAVGDNTRIDYTPDRGFTGSDRFSVRLIPGDATIDVVATVLPPAK